MKLSDKALRQIGRELLERMDTPPNQDDLPSPAQTPTPRLRGLRQRVRNRPRTAAILTFRKRLR